jgi:hypothetical protein
LRTAIRSVRSPSCSSRFLSFQKKSFLTVIPLSHTCAGEAAKTSGDGGRVDTLRYWPARATAPARVSFRGAFVGAVWPIAAWQRRANPSPMAGRVDDVRVVEIGGGGWAGDAGEEP